MDCPHCKATVPEGLAFCPSCSHRIPRDLLERSNPGASKETQITRLAGGVVPSSVHTAATATSPDGAAVLTSGEATMPGLPQKTSPRLADVSDMIGRRYKLESMLGRGGMGVVYKARDLDLGEEIAIKLLQPAATKDPIEIERFKREIVVARRITHPNVIRIHDFGSAGEDSFISMELLSGGTLTRLIESNILSLEEAADISTGICDGLEAAHQAGIIHRDLKPDNVLFDAQGRPKLVDFGLARLAAATTRTIGFSGTPFYMSPEQADGREATTLSDIYSLGVMLYEVFTGRLPFVADSLVRLAVMHAQQQPPSPRSVRPDLPAALEMMLLRCLEKDPARRYAHAADIAEDLIAWREGRALVHATAASRAGDDTKTGPNPVVSGSFRRPRTIPPSNVVDRADAKPATAEKPSKDPTLILSLRSPNDAPARGATRLGGDPTYAPPGEGERSPWLVTATIGASIAVAAALGIIFVPKIVGHHGADATPTPTAVAATAPPTVIAVASAEPTVLATRTPHADSATPTPAPATPHATRVASVATPRPTPRPMATVAPRVMVPVKFIGGPCTDVYVDGQHLRRFSIGESPVDLPEGKHMVEVWTPCPSGLSGGSAPVRHRFGTQLDIEATGRGPLTIRYNIEKSTLQILQP